MNETLRAIKERRSCRAYKADPVPEETLKAIVEAGLCAPTGMNLQDRHFTVIRDKAILERMDKLTQAKLTDPGRARLLGRNNGKPDISIHYHAPALIILSGGEVSCAIAAGNLCTAAQSLGVGSIMLGMAMFLFENDSTLARDLKIPSDKVPRLAVALGYASGEMPVPERLPGQVTYL